MPKQTYTEPTMPMLSNALVGKCKKNVKQRKACGNSGTCIPYHSISPSAMFQHISKRFKKECLGQVWLCLAQGHRFPMISKYWTRMVDSEPYPLHDATWHYFAKVKHPHKCPTSGAAIMMLWPGFATHSLRERRRIGKPQWTPSTQMPWKGHSETPSNHIISCVQLAQHGARPW